MSAEFIITVLAASLLGSTHCAGMCGPFVMLVAGANRDHPQFGLRLGAYHLGRLTTYLVLGILAGTMGATLNKTGELWGWHRLAAYIAGLAMLVTALIVLLRQLGMRIQHLPIPQHWVKLIHAGFHYAARWPAVPRAFGIGMLTTWIPCGWLYAFVLVAAGTGAVLPSLIVMLAFWAGTVSLLTLLGWSSASVVPGFRTALPWISIAACLILGLFTIFSRASIQVDYLDHQLAGTMSPGERVQRASEAKLPCCHDD